MGESCCFEPFVKSMSLLCGFVANLVDVDECGKTVLKHASSSDVYRDRSRTGGVDEVPN